MANTPFIVYVQRCDKPCESTVTARSVSGNQWPAIWMNASDFPLMESQDCGYFICAAKGNKLTVYEEVFLKGTLKKAEPASKPFLMRVYRMNHPCTRALNPLVVAQSIKLGVYPSCFAEADLFPMKEGQREAYFICTRRGEKLRVHREVARKGHRF